MRGGRVPALLREDVRFRRLWTAQTISLVGDQVTAIALPLTGVLVLDAGPGQMGLLTAAGYLPHLLFSLHAGAFVDRRGRRRHTMIAADLARAGLVATIPVADALGRLTLAQLYVVAFLTGALTVLFQVSYGTLFAALVERARYVEASSLTNGSRAFSFIVGPSLGGVLVQVLRAPLALAVDAVSFLASAVFLGRISADEPPPEPVQRGHLAAGVRWIRRTPTAWTALASTATINFFNFAFFALFVLYATRTLGVSAGALGIVLGAGAVGGLVGSVVTGRLTRRLGVGGAFVVGAILFPAPFLLVPAADGPHAVVLACLFLAEFGSGVGVMVLDISVGAIITALTPERLRARVTGAYMVVNNGIRPLGSLVGGALGAAIGVRPTLWLAAAGALLGCLWLLPSPIPRLRELPEPAD